MRIPRHRRRQTLDLRLRQAPQAAVVDCTLFRRAGTRSGGTTLELELVPEPRTEPVPELGPEPGPETAGGGRGRGRGFESFESFESSWDSVGPPAAAGLAGLPGLAGLAGSRRRNGPLTLTLTLVGGSLAGGDGDLEAEDVIVRAADERVAELLGAGTAARSRWWEGKELQLSARDRTRIVIVLKAPFRKEARLIYRVRGAAWSPGPPAKIQPKTSQNPAPASPGSESQPECSPLHSRFGPLPIAPTPPMWNTQQSCLARRGGQPALTLQSRIPNVDAIPLLVGQKRHGL